MFKRLVMIVILLSAIAPIAWCDWDGHSSHGGGGMTPDPRYDAFFADVFLVLALNTVLLVIGVPVLLFFGGSNRVTAWLVTVVNLGAYILQITLREYPGGFMARFRPPGLWFTLGELFSLVCSGLIIILIIIAVRWVKNKLQSLFSKHEATT